MPYFEEPSDDSIWLRPALRARARAHVRRSTCSMLFFCGFNTPLWTWSSTDPNVAYRIIRQPRKHMCLQATGFFGLVFSILHFGPGPQQALL